MNRIPNYGALLLSLMISVSSCTLENDREAQEVYSWGGYVLTSDVLTQAQLQLGMGSFEGKWSFQGMVVDGEISVKKDTFTVQFPSELLADYFMPLLLSPVTDGPMGDMVDEPLAHRDDWVATDRLWQLPYSISGYSDNTGYLNFYNHSAITEFVPEFSKDRLGYYYIFEVAPEEAGWLGGSKFFVQSYSGSAQFDMSARQWTLLFHIESILIVNMEEGREGTMERDVDMTLMFVTTKKIQ